jgi:hypothetical protein
MKTVEAALCVYGSGILLALWLKPAALFDARQRMTLYGSSASVTNFQVFCVASAVAAYAAAHYANARS